MAGDNHSDRLTKLEAEMGHLIRLSEIMGDNLQKLTEQVLLQRNLTEQVTLLNQAREDHEKRITLGEHKLAQLEPLQDEVRRNSFIGKLVTAIGAASFSGLVAYVVGH